jgi:hypothetical protein
MAITRNNQTITRVYYNGTPGRIYYRTVIRNGTTVFNLSNWTPRSAAGYTLSSTYNLGNYNHPSSVPSNTLGTTITSGFPPENYGSGTIFRATVDANILNAFWSYIFFTSSDQGYPTIAGSYTSISQMQTALNSSYPPGLYQGQYYQVYNFNDGYYYIFQAQGSGYTTQFIRYEFYDILQTA